MPGVTDEQIAAARSVDLLTYLQDHEPGSFKKSGPGEYCLVEHDSLKISHGKWFWFSRGFGSNNALDFLMQVRGQSFPEAVNILADGRVAPPPPSRPRPLPEKQDDKLFALPLPNRNYHRAIAYLTFERLLRGMAERPEPTIGKTQTEFYKNSKRMGEISEKDGGYWDSNTEMTARAFAIYVMETLPGRSDYLAGHAQPTPLPARAEAAPDIPREPHGLPDFRPDAPAEQLSFASVGRMEKDGAKPSVMDKLAAAKEAATKGSAEKPGARTKSHDAEL